MIFMTIMIANDDGLTDGIRILSKAAHTIDKNSYTITPSQQQSAVAKGITLHKILRLRRVENEKMSIYELNGTPADCVSFGICSGEFKKPDLVLSGINIGNNLSMHSLYSSGTIGACLEAAIYKIPGIAFSLEIHKENKESANYGEWKKHGTLVKKVVQILKMLKGKIPPYAILNVNLPIEFENANIVFPRPAFIQYVSVLEKRIDPNGRNYYWQYGENKECEKESDVYELCVNKNITITPISLLKVVDDELIERLRKAF